MSLDTLTLQAVVDECAELADSKIIAIDQTGPAEIVLTLKGRAEPHALAVSVQPDYGRIYRRRPPKRSTGSSALLGALRDHLTGGVLEAIEAVPDERIACIRCAGGPPDRPQKYRLIAELIGRQTMLALVAEEDRTIIETMRRVRTGDREIAPGEPYEWPEKPARIALRDLRKEDLARIAEADTPERLIKSLVRQVGSLSPAVARELVAAAGLLDAEAFGRHTVEARTDRLWSACEALLDRLSARAWSPTLGLDEAAQPVILSPIPIVSLPRERIMPCGSMSEAIDRYYTAKLQRETRRQRVQQVRRALSGEAARLERLEAHLTADLEVAAREDEFRRAGELLIAHVHTLQQGQTEAEVVDFYDPAQRTVRIALDPALGPAENAQRYFKRAKKARDGRRIIEQRLARTRERLDEVRAIVDRLERDLETGGHTAEGRPAGEAESEEAAVSRAYRACIRLGLIKEKKIRTRGGKKRRPMEIHPRRFVTSDGSIVLVGRNSRENEILTKTAAPDDIWLHARDMGGSHVILRREGRKAMPSKQACYEAACVAAYFSKGRGSTTVPVDYTERRYVRKMKHGGPGQVVFTHEKTLFVEPRLLPEQDDARAGETAADEERHRT